MLCFIVALVMPPIFWLNDNLNWNFLKINMCVFGLWIELTPSGDCDAQHQIYTIWLLFLHRRLSLWCAIKCKNIYWRSDIGCVAQLNRKTITKITTKLFSFFSHLAMRLCSRANVYTYISTNWIHMHMYIYPEQGRGDFDQHLDI